jgi:nitrogen fixation-related uncharacterized protein
MRLRPRADRRIEDFGGSSAGRGRNRQVLAAAGIVLAVGLVVAVISILAVEYARQSERVDDLEAQNEGILSDHGAIGDQFAEQSKRFEQEARKLERSVRSAYARGYRAGRETASLPPSLRSLGGLAAVGFLVPRRVPANGERGLTIRREVDGYTVRWQRLAVFASRLEPLNNWTRQSLGELRKEKIGPHLVSRLIGPSGVIYAWRKGAVTYAVIAAPAEDSLARAMISSMR